MGKCKIIIPKNELYQLYIVENKTLKEIANLYNCCTATVSNLRDTYKIPVKTTKSWLATFNRETKKKYNNYDLTKSYGIGFTSNTQKEFYFDLEDYNKIKTICWSENSEGYLVGRSGELNKVVKLHQLVLNAKHIDHINHNKLDNRKENLRLSNDQLNSRNRITPKNNKVGCKGVCWKTREKKWRAYITHNGKHIELGMYDNLTEAIQVRKKAEVELFGDWSYYKSLNLEV